MYMKSRKQVMILETRSTIAYLSSKLYTVTALQEQFILRHISEVIVFIHNTGCHIVSSDRAD